MASCDRYLQKIPDNSVIAIEAVVGLSEDALLHLLLLRRCHLLVLGNDQVSIGTACLNCFGSVMEGLVQAILQFCFRSGFFQLFKLSNCSHRSRTTSIDKSNNSITIQSLNGRYPRHARKVVRLPNLSTFLNILGTTPRCYRVSD